MPGRKSGQRNRTRDNQVDKPVITAENPVIKLPLRDNHLSLKYFAKGIAMNRTWLALVIAFGTGCLLTATTLSGCSEPADRTLTIHQLQSSLTYDGKFRIDTSELPDDAIESKSDIDISGKPGKPSTRINLNAKYEIEVVLRVVEKESSQISIRP